MVQLASTNDNTILVKRAIKSVEWTIHEEKASQDLTPGELVIFDGSGDLTPAATAPSLDTDVGAAPKVVLPLTGDGIGDDVSSGERTPYVVPQPGDIVLLFLDTGTSAEVNVSKGDVLEPSGTAGNVRIQQGIAQTSSGTESFFNGHIHFEAVEDLDNSSASSRSRIKAMRL